MKKNIMQAVAALVAAAALAPALAGCSTPAQASAERTCDAAVVVDDTTPTVALLGQVGGALDPYADDLELVVQGAVDTGSRLIINGVGEADAPSLLVDALMVGEGNNPMERKLDLKCKRDAVAPAVAQLGATDATRVDLFRALMTLDGNLTERSGAPVDVALLTSLASDATPVDLTDPAVLADPIGALNDLASASLIPDCTGWRFHGISTAREDDAALREFWRQYALRCGGALVAWTTHLTVFPGNGDPLDKADTGLIIVKEDDDSLTTELSGDVLFGPDSYELRPEADDGLHELLALIEKSHGAVTIVGHTDLGGSEAESVTLSNNRSGAVAAWLIAHGVDPSRITTDGRGSSEVIYTNPQTDAEHQANRRVVVTIGKA